MLQRSMATREGAKRLWTSDNVQEMNHAQGRLYRQAGTQGRPYRRRLSQGRRVQEGSRGARVADGQRAGQGRQERRLGPLPQPQRRRQERLGNAAQAQGLSKTHQSGTLMGTLSSA